MISILKRALVMEIVQSLRTLGEPGWNRMESDEGRVSGLEVVVLLLKAKVDGYRGCVTNTGSPETRRQ